MVNSVTFPVCDQCYSACQVLLLFLSASLNGCNLCVLIYPVALPVSWSMLLLSLSDAYCCYSASVSVVHCCYPACQVVNATLPDIWSALFPCLKGGQCCYFPCQFLIAVTLPLRWSMSLLFLTVGHCLVVSARSLWVSWDAIIFPKWCSMFLLTFVLYSPSYVLLYNTLLTTFNSNV